MSKETMPWRRRVEDPLSCRAGPESPISCPSWPPPVSVEARYDLEVLSASFLITESCEYVPDR